MKNKKILIPLFLCSLFSCGNTSSSENNPTIIDGVNMNLDIQNVYIKQGEKYNLPEYVDKNTGFISYKSKDGRDLKALELPGLWNGAMSDWNTIFVEVPIETFNPVKTVNDLLRPEHQ